MTRSLTAASPGFTLVEVLLALLIAGLVMVGTYSVTSQVMRLSEDAKTSLAMETAAETLRLALGNDVGSVIYVELAQKRGASDLMAFYSGQDATALSSGDDKLLLSLATAATLDPGASFPSWGFFRVEYVLRQPESKGVDKNAGNLLVRRELPVATVSWRETSLPPFRETVLFEGVETCTLTFFESAATAAVETWDSRKRQNARLAPLPVQLRLAVTATVGGQRRSLDLRIDLPERTLSFGGRS